MFESLLAALPKALWHWCFERWKKMDGWSGGCLHGKLEHHKFLMFFFKHSKNQIDHRAGEMHFFELESHACQSKLTSMLQTFFDKSHKCQHLLEEPNWSPRRRNAFFWTWVTRLPIEINVHVANILWQVPQMPAFCLLAFSLEVLNFKFVTLTRAASQPVTLFYPH